MTRAADWEQRAADILAAVWDLEDMPDQRRPTLEFVRQNGQWLGHMSTGTRPRIRIASRGTGVDRTGNAADLDHETNMEACLLHELAHALTFVRDEVDTMYVDGFGYTVAHTRNDWHGLAFCVTLADIEHKYSTHGLHERWGARGCVGKSRPRRDDWSVTQCQKRPE